MTTNLLPYFVMRSAAIELDRQGVRPSLLVRVLAGITALSLLGLLAIGVLVACVTGLSMAGVIH